MLGPCLRCSRALSIASAALAAGQYCQATNGRDQIAKTGSTCPVNYLASGACCIALQADSPQAFAKLPGDRVRPGHSSATPATARVLDDCYRPSIDLIAEAS